MRKRSNPPYGMKSYQRQLLDLGYIQTWCYKCKRTRWFRPHKIRKRPKSLLSSEMKKIYKCIECGVIIKFKKIREKEERT